MPSEHQYEIILCGYDDNRFIIKILRLEYSINIVNIYHTIHEQLPSSK